MNAYDQLMRTVQKNTLFLKDLLKSFENFYKYNPPYSLLWITKGTKRSKIAFNWSKNY